MHDDFRNIELDKILLTESFDNILKNAQSILETPELYNCQSPIFSFRNAYAPIHLSLGNLLQLWLYNKFVDTCTNCGNDIYIFSGGGNLGGSISYWEGICPNCKSYYLKSADGQKSIFIPLLRTFMDLNKTNFFKKYDKIKTVELKDLVVNFNRN